MAGTQAVAGRLSPRCLHVLSTSLLSHSLLSPSLIASTNSTYLLPQQRIPHDGSTTRSGERRYRGSGAQGKRTSRAFCGAGFIAAQQPLRAYVTAGCTLTDASKQRRGAGRQYSQRQRMFAACKMRVVLRRISGQFISYINSTRLGRTGSLITVQATAVDAG